MLELEIYDFLVGQIVLRECGASTERRVRDHAESGRIAVLAGNVIPYAVYVDLLGRFQLGDGETECLAAGKTIGCMIATDDRKARHAVVELLGADYLTGTLGLLRDAVSAGLIGSEDAVVFHETMKRLGSFLPAVDDSFFHV